MSKYVIKNCPCFDKDNTQCLDTPVLPITEMILCKDRTDCVMKQIVDLCKKDKNFCINCKAKADDNIDCIECIEGGRAELGAEILELLDIQEFE